MLAVFATTTIVAAQTPSSSALLVVSKGDSALVIVDPANNKVTGRIPTGKEPHNVAASADGRLAFVSNVGDNTISVIDLTTQKEIHRVELGNQSRPHGVVYLDGKLYFTADGYKLIGCYDVASNKVEWLLGTGVSRGEMLVLNRAKTRLFTANNTANAVVAIERTAQPPDWAISSLAVGQGPQGIDMSPDEKEIWVVHERDGSVAIIDTTTKKVTQTLTMQGTKRSNRLKFSPDGARVFVTDTDYGLIVLDSSTRKEIKRIPIGTRMADVVITPDGTRAFVADASSGAVAVVDLKTLEVIGRILTGPVPEGMAWSERK